MLLLPLIARRPAAPVTPAADASRRTVRKIAPRYLGVLSESPLQNFGVTSGTSCRAQAQEIAKAPLHHEDLSRAIQSTWRAFSFPLKKWAGALLLGVNASSFFNYRNSPSCEPDLTAVSSPNRTRFERSAVTEALTSPPHRLGRWPRVRLLLDIADSLYRVFSPNRRSRLFIELNGGADKTALWGPPSSSDENGRFDFGGLSRYTWV